MNTNPEKRSLLLAVCYVVALMIPNVVLAVTEPYSMWSKAALIALPLGVYMLLSVASKRSGIVVWSSFILFIACAFQIVLLYLFGNSIIATDMFTNVLTTNPGEATELLSNIYPSVILVCVIYLPLLWFAYCEIRHKRVLAQSARRVVASVGGVFCIAGLILLIPAYSGQQSASVVKDEIFPVNVFYNLKLSISEFRKTRRFEKSSQGFSFHAKRTAKANKREIYIYVIGEASRAVSWQLYGYDRTTNPELSRMNDIVVFKDVLTQSNTTHKSVPMLLSSVATNEHSELFRRKGLPEIFKESDFKTYFISNQAPQGAMIDKLASDSDSIVYIKSPRFDMQMIEVMDEVIKSDTTQNLFFVLHCYGSHFSYHQRYTDEFAHFKPDDDVAITAEHMHFIRNAYDNSIVYTDHFLASVINYMRGVDACSAMLFCSDHGEDLMDDERCKFLHASPTTTFYQLYVASLVWFSSDYRVEFGDKVSAAELNASAPATTHAMFHTMVDIASITGDYVKQSVSLVNTSYDKSAPRFYLNDHNQAVPFRRTGLSGDDYRKFKEFGIEL